MMWDNWGLPYEEETKKDSLKLLAIYFINLKCFQHRFELEFKQQHPVRAKLSDETLEDYDSYLTQHLLAYRTLLESKNLEYMQEADVHLAHKLPSVIHNKQLQIHPVEYTKQIDSNNLVAAACVLYSYGFTSILNDQPSLYNIFIHTLKNARKLPLLNDLLLILYAKFGDVENAGLLLVTTKAKPTVLSKFAIKVYLTRKSFGRLWSQTIDCLKD